MPVGRIYQAPTTVPRNTPVFGYNGLKSVSNSDLVITGKAVRSKKSKSKSPSPPTRTLSTSTKLLSTSNRNLNRKSKSPSPGEQLKLTKGNSTN